MYGERANSREAVSLMLESVIAEAGPLVQGQPVCYDIDMVAGTTLSDGGTVNADQAVTNFGATPAADNMELFAGAAINSVDQGEWEPIAAAGPCLVRVYNGTADDLTLPVGTLIGIEAGNAYFVPVLQANTDGTGMVLTQAQGRPVGFLRQQRTIATLETSLFRAYLWPQSPPRRWAIQRDYPDGLLAAVTDRTILAVTGPGRLLRVGVGCDYGGSRGSVEVDVLKNGTSIFSQTPIVAYDCLAPFHSLIHADAPGAASGPGTGGRYGTYDASIMSYRLGDRIGMTLTPAGGWDGYGLQIHVDGLEV